MTFLAEQNFKEQYQIQLTERAKAISRTLTTNSELLNIENMDLQNTDNTRHRMGMNTERHRRMHALNPQYVQVIDEILLSNVWVIDENDKEITVAPSESSVDYTDFTVEIQTMLDRVFAGETEVTEAFSHYFDDSMMSVATPYFSPDGVVTGAVLLHEKVSIQDGFRTFSNQILLTSTLFAILVVIGLAIVMAKKFVKPINRMGVMALQLTQEDYDFRSHIQQKDEIGALANHLDTLAVRLETSKREREESEQLRKDFISNLSHELKTPVTSMRCSIEALRDGIIEPEETEGYYQTLYNDSIHLEKLIRDLLELTSLQNLHFPMNVEKFQLANALSDAVRSQQSFAKTEGKTIVWDHGLQDIRFEGDYTRIRQLFTILINNAIKYSEEGGTIRISSEERDTYCTVSVHNNGGWIDVKEQEKIFATFYQMGRSTGKGFGLGLAIAKEISNRHGIDIRVYSTKEKGTSFTLTFRISENEKA